MKYQLLEKDKARFIGLIILNEIIQFQHYFPVKVQGNDVYLQNSLEMLAKADMLAIKNGKYIPTDKGRKEVETLYAKYLEYLKIFDIYCAVDLKKGEFAFARMKEDWADEDWTNFINEDRFKDVRVAVADFKGLNPIEIVFLSYLNDGRFDCSVDKWQDYLTADAIWNEIVEVCNSATSIDYLKEEGVIEPIVTEGSALALRLIKEAEESIAARDEIDNGGEEVVTETTTETTEEVEEYVDVVEMPYYGYSYWEPYYDPFYISPLWLVAPVLFF